MNVMNFLPREEKFFVMLQDLASQAHTSSLLLNQFLESPDVERVKLGYSISETKAQAKASTESLTAEVCRTFITPFDREDIQTFALNLYKIPKVIEKIKDRLIAHNLRPMNGDFVRQMNIIVQEANAMEAVVQELFNGRNSKDIHAKTGVLQELEHQGDELLAELQVYLFKEVEDIRELLLRKDIYEMMEKVVDFYRDAATIALQIILKHS